MPYNKFATPVRIEKTFTTLSTESDKVTGLTCDLRNVKHADVEYDGKGTSGDLAVTVDRISGALIDIAFAQTEHPDPTTYSGSDIRTPFASASGPGLSGGTVTIWAYGD